MPFVLPRPNTHVSLFSFCNPMNMAPAAPTPLPAAASAHFGAEIVPEQWM